MLFPGLHIYSFLPLLYFNSNIIKATVNDDSTLDVSGSLTKSQKNFSSASSSSNNNASRSPRSPGQPRRREVTEEEAERSAVFSSPHMFPLELFFSHDHLHTNVWLAFETFQTVQNGFFTWLNTVKNFFTGIFSKWTMLLLSSSVGIVAMPTEREPMRIQSNTSSRPKRR